MAHHSELQRPERAVDQRRLVESQVTHVTLAQVKLHAGGGRTGPGLGEHRRRGVDSDDLPASGLRDRDRNAPVADRQLDQRAIKYAASSSAWTEPGRRGQPLLHFQGTPRIRRAAQPGGDRRALA